MSYSSIHFNRRNSEIIYWEYEGDEKVLKKAPAPLYFYIESDEGDYTTIFGNKARKVTCSNFNDYQDKREKYKEMGAKIFESDVPIETKFIIENYVDKVLVPPKFDIFYIDIEVHSESGFPKPDDAAYPVTVITVYSTKDETYYIFAEKNFNTDFLEKDGEKFKKVIIKEEHKLLKFFAKWLRTKHPDLLSGWNSNGYDIPYIINRMKNILGENSIKNLSPIKTITSRKVRLTQTREEMRYEIKGINSIDMLEVYQNYTFSQQESWKLDFIAEMEIGEKKIPYDGSLSDLYNNDWQKYVEYNVQDVRLLKRLEDKKGFLNILVTFCYGCRVPFEFYQKTTKVLDGAFISELFKQKIVLPDVNRDLESVSFPGGFVKDPQQGKHEWIVSFDATSLYPSIMIGWNISPEQKQFVIEETQVNDVISYIRHLSLNENTTLSGTEIISVGNDDIELKELANIIIDNNFCLCMNGSVFSQDEVGIVPKFVQEWFNKRKEYKGRMLKAKAEKDKDAEKLYDNLQLNYKILINSVYGYLSTRHSRFYDLDCAKAVTLTGQGITKTTANSLNEFFNSDMWVNESKKRFNKKASKFENFVIYGDTDSCHYDSMLKVNCEYDMKIGELFEKLQKDFVVKNGNDGKEFIFPDNLKLPYFCENDQKIKTGNVEFLYRHKVKKPLFRIKTKSGNYVDVTEDHSCMILDNGKLVEKKPREIKRGDKVVRIIYK